MRGVAWRTTLLGVRKVSSRANSEASGGRRVRYEKVKTRRASRTWPNHAKCPASVSPTVRCITVRLSSRENIAHRHTRAAADAIIRTYATFANMYTHTYNKGGISGQTGRAGISLQASIIEREEERSEREKVTAEAENHSLYRHQTDPSRSTKNLLPLVPHCYPLPSLLSAAPQSHPKPREYQTMCTVRKRTRRIARFTYQRISILIPWIQFTSLE